MRFTPRSRPTPPRLPGAVIGAMLACGLLAGCSLPDFMSFPPQVRGNKVTDEQVKELVPGTTSRADVASLIGSPTAKATFDDNTWLYITETTKPVIGATNEVRDQAVLVVKFDAAGVVQSVTRRGADDSLPVSVATRTTPAPGSDASLMQQLLGNVGRFNPGGAAASSSSGAGRGVTGAY